MPGCCNWRRRKQEKAMSFGDYHSLGRSGPSLFARAARSLHLDLPLLIGLLVLCGAGLAILYSASGENIAMLWRQALRLGIALAALVVAAQVTPHVLRLWTPWLYTTGLVLLLVVMFTGDTAMGAQRWLDLGLIRFQPSEMMKLAVPMMVAWYLRDRPLPPSLPDLLVLAVLVGVPVFLIAEQPDLGTAVLVTAAGCFAIYL